MSYRQLPEVCYRHLAVVLIIEWWVENAYITSCLVTSTLIVVSVSNNAFVQHICFLIRIAIFYVSLTMHFSINLANDQIDA